MILFFLYILFTHTNTQETPPAFKCARLKYSGGGDWYNDPAAVPNLMRYIKDLTGINTPKKEDIVNISDPALFQYSFVFMTGHGNINFSNTDASNLRLYLNAGGFLYVDDDYGMDASFNREIKKVFPDHELTEIPHTHPIYTTYFKFQNGFPKIHEHDGESPRAYGIFIKNRLAVLYTHETNPSDGWVATHNDPSEIREEAFKIGANIVLASILN